MGKLLQLLMLAEHCNSMRRGMENLNWKLWQWFGPPNILEGHPCDVFADHEALQAIMNTCHPSGKLARWGMALQEMDLCLHYRPGKTN